jgi:hypothetical protein
VLSQQPSSRNDPDSEREVFRSAGSAILSWAWFVVALIVLVDLAVQGRDHAALVTAVLVLAITGVVYSCAWRPKIVADTNGITVINPVRDHWVPWAAITNVDVVNAVRVHCAPVAGAARGKILYSWAVQSSARSARKAALRREAHSQPRMRLTPRPRSMRPPPGMGPRGYGEIPEPARDALERSSAEFTAGRLAERAQHAKQAARTAARPPAGARPDEAGLLGAPAGDGAAAGPPADGLATGNGPATGDGPLTGLSFAAGTGSQAGAQNGGPAAATVGPPAHVTPVARWAWLSIAAMTVPLLVLLLVVLV